MFRHDFFGDQRVEGDYEISDNEDEGENVGQVEIGDPEEMILNDSPEHSDSEGENEEHADDNNEDWYSRIRNGLGSLTSQNRSLYEAFKRISFGEKLEIFRFLKKLPDCCNYVDLSRADSNH